MIVVILSSFFTDRWVVLSHSRLPETKCYLGEVKTVKSVVKNAKKCVENGKKCGENGKKCGTAIFKNGKNCQMGHGKNKCKDYGV